MTPFILQHRNVYLRVDHTHVGIILAAKLRARTDRDRLDSGFRVVGR